MAKKPASLYDNMTASDLARITRERKLEKPNVITLREWADFLEADDAKRLLKAQAVDTDEDRDTAEPDASAQDNDIDKPSKATPKKGKS